MRKRNKIVDRLTSIIEKAGVGDLRISVRGVPHIVIGTNSICWFENRQAYRCFSDYGRGGPQDSFWVINQEDAVKVATAWRRGASFTDAKTRHQCDPDKVPAPKASPIDRLVALESKVSGCELIKEHGRMPFIQLTSGNGQPCTVRYFEKGDFFRVYPSRAGEDTDRIDVPGQQGPELVLRELMELGRGGQFADVMNRHMRVEVLWLAPPNATSSHERRFFAVPYNLSNGLHQWTEADAVKAGCAEVLAMEATEGKIIRWAPDYLRYSWSLMSLTPGQSLRMVTRKDGPIVDAANEISDAQTVSLDS